ncbi:MAG: hypothetical protein ISR65_04715 [Bacteriovoracaceae bacterium]|nr:hypothetical protein [Bacteriovoracaceae bacterium]
MSKNLFVWFVGCVLCSNVALASVVVKSYDEKLQCQRYQLMALDDDVDKYGEVISRKDKVLAGVIFNDLVIDFKNGTISFKVEFDNFGWSGNFKMKERFYISKNSIYFPFLEKAVNWENSLNFKRGYTLGFCARQDGKIIDLVHGNHEWEEEDADNVDQDREFTD